MPRPCSQATGPLLPAYGPDRRFGIHWPPMKPLARNTLWASWLMILSDARRYEGRWWRAPGFWTSLSYRIRNAARTGPWYRRALLMLNLLTWPRRCRDAELPSSAEIGPGLYLPHPQGVILGGQSRIGPHVAIFQQVTLGAWNGASPRIAAHASLFAGAKIIGKVAVGRRAFVGANAVVLGDVPPWHSAVGVPAKCVRRKDVPEAATTAFLPAPANPADA